MSRRVLIGAVAVCMVIGAGFAIRSKLRHDLIDSPSYSVATEYIEEESGEVSQQFGHVVTYSMESGCISKSGKEGVARFEFSVTGMRTKGTLQVDMIWDEKLWKIARTTFAIDGKQRLVIERPLIRLF